MEHDNTGFVPTAPGVQFIQRLTDVCAVSDRHGFSASILAFTCLRGLLSALRQRVRSEKCRPHPVATLIVSSETRIFMVVGEMSRKGTRQDPLAYSIF